MNEIYLGCWIYLDVLQKWLQNDSKDMCQLVDIFTDLWISEKI